MIVFGDTANIQLVIRGFSTLEEFKPLKNWIYVSVRSALTHLIIKCRDFV